MNINFDEKIIESTLNQVANVAIANALNSHDVKRIIEEKINRVVVENILSDSLLKAVERIDIDNLVIHLSQELSKAITRATVHIIKESAVEILLNLKKIPDYERELKERVRAEIRQLLK